MMGMKIEIVVLIGEDKLFFFLKKIYFTIKFFTDEERRKFAVFIQNFFMIIYLIEFITKVINFWFFFNCHHHAK